MERVGEMFPLILRPAQPPNSAVLAGVERCTDDTKRMIKSNLQVLDVLSFRYLESNGTVYIVQAKRGLALCPIVSCDRH